MTELTQTALDDMDQEDFSFFLAYGKTQKDEELDSLLDVEMYNMIGADEGALIEACDSSVLY